MRKELAEFDWMARTDGLPLPVAFVPITLFDVSRMGKTESKFDRKLRMLTQLSKTCSACTMCELGRQDAKRGDILRDPHVFSNLNPVRFVVVGQNPGWNELAQGEPFVGDAGNNWDKELERNELSRKDFYITNATKCFTKGNAKPSHKHQERCRPFLMMELALINPLLVISLGASAFECLCPGVKFGDSLKKVVKSERFNVKVFPIYHPSPRNLSSPGREDMFKDQIRLLSKVIKKLKQ